MIRKILLIFLVTTCTNFLTKAGNSETRTDLHYFISPKCRTIETCLKLANTGDKYAQFALAEIYAFGKDVPKDEIKALYWYQKSSKHGYSKATYEIGKIHAFGTGVPKDTKKAIEFYKLAAKQGNIDSQALLGDLFLNGHPDLEKDEKRAIEFYEMAAKQGHIDSHYYLSLLYYENQRDLIKAYAWAYLYLKHTQDTEMVKIIEDLSKKLSDEEQKQAMEFARGML